MKLTNVQIIDAMQQSRNDQLAFIKAKLGDPKIQTLPAYSAGFDEGWRQAVRYLKLHEALKVSQKLQCWKHGEVDIPCATCDCINGAV